MQESFDDLFDLTTHVDAICIPTNGIVKKSGEAVMGAGVAKLCAVKWPQTQYILGEFLTEGKNLPYQLGMVNKLGEFWTKLTVEDKNSHICRVFSFPTKHHFKDNSDLELIKRSCQQMVIFATALKMDFIALPRVGAGLGGLSWENEVRPAISKILDDRFHIVTPKGN